MKRERIVEFVGGSEEDIAYLRLSLRKAARQLAEKWRLRREDDSHVDLLVIEDHGEAGALSPDGASRRVRLVDPAFGAAGMETAPWPLALDTLIRLFNLTACVTEISRPEAAPMIQHNIYDDLFDSGPSDRWRTSDNIVGDAGLHEFGDGWQMPARVPEAELMWQAEQLFRDDPRTRDKDVLKSIRLHDEVDVEATEGITVRGVLRKERQGAIGSAPAATPSLSTEDANARHPMAAYVGGRMLPGPSRIQAFQVEITLDPRNRQFYAKGALCVLEDCCRQPLRRGAWQALTASEFAAVKQQCSPRPFAELLWLCTYLDDSAAEADYDTRLRYRLMENLDLKRDYPQAARVADELVRGSSLAAAATAARVPLAEAQRVAAAFDAVGFLVPE